jgi:hypothetical protein
VSAEAEAGRLSAPRIIEVASYYLEEPTLAPPESRGTSASKTRVVLMRSRSTTACPALPTSCRRGGAIARHAPRRTSAKTALSERHSRLASRASSTHTLRPLNLPRPGKSEGTCLSIKPTARRDRLADAELERLLPRLRTKRIVPIRDPNYPPDRMERYGKPYLNRLEERVDETQRLMSERAKHST